MSSKIVFQLWTIIVLFGMLYFFFKGDDFTFPDWFLFVTIVFIYSFPIFYYYITKKKELASTKRIIEVFFYQIILVIIAIIFGALMTLPSESFGFH